MIPIASVIAFGLPLTITMKVDLEKGEISKYRLGILVKCIMIKEIDKLVGKKIVYIDSLNLSKQGDEVEFVLHLVNGESVSLGSNLYVNNKQMTIGDYLIQYFRIHYVEEVIRKSTNVV